MSCHGYPFNNSFTLETMRTVMVDKKNDDGTKKGIL